MWVWNIRGVRWSCTNGNWGKLSAHWSDKKMWTSMCARGAAEWKIRRKWVRAIQNSIVASTCIWRSNRTVRVPNRIGNSMREWKFSFGHMHGSLTTQTDAMGMFSIQIRPTLLQCVFGSPDTNDQPNIACKHIFGAAIRSAKIINLLLNSVCKWNRLRSAWLEQTEKFSYSFVACIRCSSSMLRLDKSFGTRKSLDERERALNKNRNMHSPL